VKLVLNLNRIVTKHPGLDKSYSSTSETSDFHARTTGYWAEVRPWASVFFGRASVINQQ